MSRPLVFSTLFLCLGLTCLPTEAGKFEDDVRARWRGAWILTEIETYSTCSGVYFNNDVSGQFVAAKAGRKFEPGEIAKVDKLQVRRKKIELYLTVTGRTLLPRQEGPFTLYDERSCQMELEIAIPRDVLKSKDVEAADRLLASVAQRFSTQDDVFASSDWNGREADEYPADYERTLAHHAVWSAEQTNLSIDEQLENSLLLANELAREVEQHPLYLEGFAEGARVMREWRERDCGRLVGSTAVTFRIKAPDEFAENDIWCDGYHDGQALVYNLAMLTRLPACYVEVPELPNEYADDTITRR